jgi:hypothetical protein
MILMRFSVIHRMSLLLIRRPRRRLTQSKGETSQVTVSRNGPMAKVTSQQREIMMRDPPFEPIPVDKGQDVEMWGVADVVRDLAI